MALIERVDTRERLAPGARCLVGRAGTAELQLRDRSVSAEHASLFWNGESWAVRDLGSRNGTFVGERRLAAGESVEVATGDELRFGGAGRWVIRHDGPPTAMAVPLDGDALALDGARFASRELLALPDEEDPDITVRRHGERWVLEGEDDSRPIDGGTKARIGAITWAIFVPPDAEQVVATTAFSTGLQPSLADARLEFGVSADEEHVTLTVHIGAEAWPVKPRSHHYLLLTLARQRLEDSESGVSDSEAGWLHAEDLQRMLLMDRRALNTQVFRARRQLADFEFEGGADIIERRDPARQLRIGVAALKVDKLG